MAVKIWDGLKRDILRRGQGTWYGYQGILKIYSGSPNCLTVDSHNHHNVYGVEDVAKEQASKLEKAALFEVTVLDSKCSKGKSYISHIKQLPISRSRN